MEFTYNITTPRRLQTAAVTRVPPPMTNGLNNYDEEDEMSSSSYNFQTSNASTITIESPPQSSPATLPKKHVRKMIELFDSKAKSSTTSVVSAAGSLRQQSRGANTCSTQFLCGGGSGSGGVGVGKPNTNQMDDTVTTTTTTKTISNAHIERCGRCNAVKRCECSNSSQCTVAAAAAQNSHFRSDLDSSGSPTKNLNYTNGCSASFHEGHQSNQWAPSLDATETRNVQIQPGFGSTSELSQNIGILPIATMYNSKTTILRTPNGVRIVVDINMFEQLSPNANLASSRVETDIPQSRILESFQRQTMMSLGSAYASN